MIIQERKVDMSLMTGQRNGRFSGNKKFKMTTILFAYSVGLAAYSVYSLPENDGKYKKWTVEEYLKRCAIVVDFFSKELF